MTRYSIQCYGVDPHTGTVCTQADSGWFPSVKPNYVFYNLGKSEVYVEAIYGTEVCWYGSITGQVLLKPGEKKTLVIDDRVYYVTAQKISNYGNHRALVHCSTVDGYSSFAGGPEIPLKIDIDKVVEVLAVFGVGKIPVVGELFSVILEYFWPSDEANVWEQIKDQVSNLIDLKIREAIARILDGDFSDGRTVVCGSNVDAAGVHRVFEMDCHHIAGIMITNDATGLRGQSASIAVSYQLTPDE